MKKKTGKVLAIVMAVLMTAALLTACSGTTITTTPKGTTFEFNKLTDDVEETTALYNFDDAILTVSLAKGTANVQICSIVPMGYINENIDDDDIYDEIDTIYEGKDLKDGDRIEINGVGGDVVVRVWGNAGKGTVKLAAKQ